MKFNPSPEAKRFALRINQLFNPELYPTEPEVTIKTIWKDVVLHFDKITNLVDVLRQVNINPEVKEK